MYEEPEDDLEQKELYRECMQWWATRETRGLLRGDAHLRNVRQEPRIHHSKDHLRGWLKTREVAEDTYKRYAPKENQPTLHRWMVYRTRES